MAKALRRGKRYSIGDTGYTIEIRTVGAARSGYLIRCGDRVVAEYQSKARAIKWAQNRRIKCSPKG